MYNFNPDVMQLDDGEATGKRRTRAQATDSPPMTDAEVRAASIAAAVELGVDPTVIEKERKAAQLAAIKAEREERQTTAAEERASSDPLKDFNNRPDAQTAATSDYIIYYSWIGGRTTGEWKPYRVPRSEDNMSAYGARAVGGPTKASITGNIKDANGLTVQPTPIRGNEGQIIGWEINGENSANRIPTGGDDGTGVPGSSGTTGGPNFGRTGGTGGTSGTGRTGVTGDSGVGAFVASDGKTFKDSDSFTIYQSGLDEKKSNKVSAYNLLFDEFDKYGLGTLVSDIKNILIEGSLDPNEFSLKVRGTDAYKARFIANEARMAKGLKALSPAAYIALEDQYQEVMRQYGLPETYYSKSATGVQEGFNKFIEGDVSAVELEDRISTAQKRVINANPEVGNALKQFYPEITNADILAYTLDPKNAIENIKRKVTTAEIGGAALQAGLQTGVNRADTLRAAGVTKETAQQGFGTIAGGLQRGSQLASIYGEDPYTQTTAETEVFNIAGAQDARKQRQKITGLEKATFGGQTGITSSALTRDRAGGY